MEMKTSAEASTDRYGYPAIFFHWSLAVLIPVQIGLGWYMLSIETQAGSGWYFALHISLGFTAALLISLRFLWRLIHVPTQLPDAIPAWQKTAARASHALLYLLLVLMPVTGYMGASFSGDGMVLFGVPLPSWAVKNDALKEQLFTAHSIIAWLLVAMIVIHVFAALKHLVVDKDTVFWRMWPR